MTDNSHVSAANAAGSPGIPALLAQILTLITAAVTGWVTLSGRFRRVRKFAADTGHLEPSFQVLYQIPLYINSAVFLLLAFSGVAALLGGIWSGAVPGLDLPGANTDFGRVSIRIYELGWVLVIGGILAGIFVWIDVVARIILAIPRAISLLPIPGLEGRFGSDGYSAGWIQAREFVRNGAEAQPMGIDSTGVDRIVVELQDKLRAEGASGSDRAPTPSGSPEIRANLALFGCIAEQLETDLKSPRRNRANFHRAFEEVSQTHHLFDPLTLRGIDGGKSFARKFRETLDPALVSLNEPELTKSPVVEAALERSFDCLKSRFQCDATFMTQSSLGFAVPAWGMYKRARFFPALGQGAMRGQFVKLAIRWGAIPIPVEAIRPWGAGLGDGIGWYLLEKGAIVPLADVKEVVFRGPVNPQIAAIAMAEGIRRTASAVADLSAESAPNLLPALETYALPQRRWMIEQETDTALWRLARATIRAAEAANWKDGWRWKLDNHVARRL